MMMKRVMVAASLSWMLMGAGLAGAEVIPVVNGDFEDRTAPNAGVAGWTEVENEPFSIVIPAAAPTAGTGTFMCRVGFKYDAVSLRQLFTNTYDTAFDYTLTFETVGSGNSSGTTPASQDITVQFFDTVLAQVVAEAVVTAEGTVTTNTLTLAGADLGTHLGNPIQIRFNKAASSPNFPWLDNVTLETATAVVTGPLVLTQPQGQVVLLGATGTVLSVGASGVDPLTYQWRFETVNLPGATNQTLALDNVGLAETGTYTVVISDTTGSTESQGAVVSIVPAPVEPGDQAVLAGQLPAAFFVTMPDRPGYSYQWTKDTLDLPGETNGVLQLPAATLADAGAYGVTTFLDGDAVLSDPAQLAVFTSVVDIPIQNPDFEDVQSSNTLNTVDGWVEALEALAGSLAIARPALSGNASQVLRLGYKYDEVSLRQALPAVYRSDLDYTLTFDVVGSVDIAGGTGATQAFQAIFFDATARTALKTVPLLAPAVSQTVTVDLRGCEAALAEAHQIDIRFYKAANTPNFAWLDNVSLTAVPTAPEVCIGRDPADQVLLLGTTQAVFSVGAAGAGTLSYQWEKDLAPLAGATNDTLLIDAPGNANEGEYRVVVSNALNTVTSTVAVLDLVAAPVAPAGLVAFTGEAVSFSVTMLTNVTGYGYAWQKNGSPLPGATDPILQFPFVEVTDTGTYSVVVSLGVDSVESGPAELVVLPPPAASYQAEVLADGPDAYWRLGEPVAATVAADEIAALDGNYGTTTVAGEAGALLRDTNTALRCLGTVDSIVRVETPRATLGDPAPFTVELWALASGGQGTTRAPVAYVDWFAATDIRGWSLFANAQNRWEFRTGEGAASDSDAWNTLVGPPVVIGQWTHLVAVHDGTDMKLYVNGFLAGTISNAVYAAINSFGDGVPCTIGGGSAQDGDVGTTGNYWTGSLDEVAIYSTALSPDRILAHYATGAAPLPPVTLTISAQPGSLELMWDATGVLQEILDLVNGTWTDVLGADSPFKPVLEEQRAYRLREP